MPTQYNIKVIAEHPLTMGFAPEGKKVLAHIESVLDEHGIEAVTASAERIDDTGGEFEAFIRRAPEVLLLGIGKLFDEELAKRANPEHELWDPAFVGYDSPSMLDLAKAIVATQQEVPS